MIPQAAADQYRIQQAIAATTVSAAGKLWRQVGTDFVSDWATVRPRMNELVAVGRSAAVMQAVPYIGEVLSGTGQVAPAAGSVVPGRFLRDAPDGRSVSDLLDETIIRSKTLVKAGSTATDALAQTGRWLTGTLLTVMADTRRQVYSADIIARPKVAGYVRMLNPPSCSRCAVLAGKWYRWNTGFTRHPRCDCLHIPASENAAGDFTTSPEAYFESLSPEQQARVFTKSGARAINDGAAINRVVNVNQRGLGTAKARKQYGTPSAFTVDDIYRVAGTRSNAIRMLSDQGYLLATPQRTQQLIDAARR